MATERDNNVDVTKPRGELGYAMSFPEIGRAMGMSANSAHETYRRAMRKIKRRKDVLMAFRQLVAERSKMQGSGWA